MTFPSSDRSTAHLNLKFTLADMDRIGDLARRQLHPADIVFEMQGRGLNLTEAEVARLLRRNGWVYPRMMGYA